MAVCDPEEGMHRIFRDWLIPHAILPLPRNPELQGSLARFLDRESGTLAGILVEPLAQGAGGMVFHTPEVLRTLRRLADMHGLPLIFDEIFTGFGRTGTMFACAAAEVVPDIVTLSKALTGGTMALSAAVARRHIFEAFLSDDPQHALMHGPTYMANPLACAAANASLDVFESEPRLAQIGTLSGWLSDGLAPCRSLPGVRDVRVMGGIGVVELAAASVPAGLKIALVERGAWIRPFRNIVYLTPAFTIGAAEVEHLCRAVYDSVSTCTKK
jgi:adenosylmethionine-8-amino-7-oxononanoate aminotransferase